MPDALAPRPPVIIDTDPSSSFVCEYVAGVNRVLSLPPYLLVDNIGRNVELWRFRAGDREPMARARYDLTSYPGDPIASLLDVDLHAAFLRRGGHELLTVNHYGRARGFDLPPDARMRPTRELQLLGDMERIVMAGDCLVGSSPRGEFTTDPARPGIFLFEPVVSDAPAPLASGGAVPLAWKPALDEWGVVTALAVSADGRRLAAAAALRLGVFELTGGRAGLRLGDCVWEALLTFHCQWLHADSTGRLWAGGHQPSASADSGDWDACRGGGVASFDVDTGVQQQATAVLPDATAWGYGADPLVVAPDGRHIYALGRDASMHVVDTAASAAWPLYGPPAELAGAAAPSLGIGHMALRDGWLYAGFSRGGFRLLRYDTRPTPIYF